ncbi:MAG: hypothetical protein KC766_00750 [Myxococcales bacterium]|nr:hypothetical protein [Myxococcales bacterium]
MIRPLRLLPLLALLCTTVSAFAAPTSPSCSRGPWIALVWGDHWSPTQRTTVLEHLRRGFEVYGVSVCERPTKPQRPPLAEVRFGESGDESVNLSVDVRDSVTRKRVGRDVDVRGYSQEARALALAIATEELVRASWVEIELAAPHGTESPARAAQPSDAPDVVRRVNRDSIRQPPARLRLGLRGMFETYSGGQTHLGVDLTLHQALGQRLGLGLGLGPRIALTETSRLGDVDARLLAGEAFAWFAVVRTDSLELDWELGLRGGVLRFQSDPASGVEQDRNAALLIAKTSLGLDLGLGTAWSLGGNVGVGHSLVGATVTGRGRELTGVSGLELHAGLGLGGRW